MQAKLTRGLLVLAGTASAVALGYGIARVRAEGVPVAQPLWYSGTVADADGKPLDDNFRVTLRLFTEATAQAGETPSCLVETKDTRIAQGRFRIDVSDCAAALHEHPDLYAELTVGDSKPFSRAKIGAVPFALEARHATSASAAAGGLAQAVVPSGAVMAFDLSSCPAGWSPFEGASGRAVVGTSAGVPVGATVGANQVTLTSNEMPAHTHPIADPGHAHLPPSALAFMSWACTASGLGFALGGYYGSNGSCPGGTSGLVATGSTASTTTGITATSASGGGKAFDNRQASIALLYCKKL